MNTPDYFFDQVVHQIKARPHVNEIIEDILLIINAHEPILCKKVAQRVSELKDPTEYSTVVELFFLDLISELNEDDRRFEQVLDLRERLRIKQYTAIPIIMDIAKKMWAAQIN